MKKQILALILLLFTSKAYGENLTVILKHKVRNDSRVMTLISDDPAKKIPNAPHYACWPSFYWPPYPGKFKENQGGSSKIWPKIVKEDLSSNAKDLIGYFVSEGYRLIHGYQRVARKDLEDIWIFSKPDPKK